MARLHYCFTTYHFIALNKTFTYLPFDSHKIYFFGLFTKQHSVAYPEPHPTPTPYLVRF